MTLPKILADIFEKEFKILYDQEKEDPKFLNAEDFSTNKERAAAAVTIAVEQVSVKLALYICKHREDAHGEDITAEVQDLINELKSEYIIDDEETKEWWNN